MFSHVTVGSNDVAKAKPFYDGIGKALGLDEAWALRAIKVAGNSGEMYETHFGPNALALPRGQNNLYSKGGLHYPLPIR